MRGGVIAIGVTVALTTLLATSTSAAGNGGSNIVGLLILAGLVGLVTYALASLLLFEDREATALASRLAAEPDSLALIDRWLQRTRFARNLGGLAGLVLWVSTWTNGVNGATMIAFGMGGVLVGAIVSELHRTRPMTGARTASLAPRALSSYLVVRDQRRAAVLVVVWIALGGVAIGNGAQTGILALAALAIATLGAVRALQWRVATRPRPALPDRLLRADDLVRELAVTRSLAQPSNIFALALLVPAFKMLGTADPTSGADFLQAIAFVLAVWWWAKNKRLGLDWLLDRPALAADHDDRVDLDLVEESSRQ